MKVTMNLNWKKTEKEHVFKVTLQTMKVKTLLH